MKEVKAVIQPFKLGEVIDALQTLPNIQGITVLRATGFGRRRSGSGLEVPASGSVNYVAKEMLLVVVPDDMVEPVLEVIQKHAHTGNYGDGLAFVTPVDEAVRLRTAERGEGAL